MADYRNSKDLQNDKDFGFSSTLNQANKLRDMLNNNQQLKQQLDQNAAMPGIKADADIKVDQAKSDQKEAASGRSLETLLGKVKTGEVPQGAGVTMDGTAITRQPNLGIYDLKKQHEDTAQINKYSTALKPLGDVTAAAAELERVTNRDGNGGVFTNPGAKLASAGKVTNALPDSVVGLGDMLGLTGSGAAEERKAIARYRQAIGVSLGGARGMSPSIQQGIQQSLGGIASGDPDLMSKGIRGAARNVGGVLKFAQSGFSPEIRQQAHDNVGMSDPADFFNSITPDGGPAKNVPLAKDPGNVKPIQQPAGGSAAPQGQAPAQGGTMKIRNKKTGEVHAGPRTDISKYPDFEEVQ